MNYDLIVVGSGASSYAFVKGIQKSQKYNNAKIAIISPNEFEKKTVPIQKEGISPKFLQMKNLLSYSYFLETFGKLKEEAFTIIGVHGIGGMARIWGSSVGVFDKQSLEKNRLNPEEMISSYKEIESFLPVCGNEKDDLYSDFSLSQSQSVVTSQRVKKLYGKHCEECFIVGAPRLLVKDSCNTCNQCLSGCEKKSIWYPSQEDFEQIDLNIDFLTGVYVEELFENKMVCYNQNQKKLELTFSQTVLAAGVFQNYKLLASMSNINDKRASIYNTPAMAFAFLDLSRNKIKDFFGMGNATFTLKKYEKRVFYGNLYDGYSLSIAKGKVFSKNFLIDKIMKFASQFMVAGAGFTASSNSNVTINMQNNEVVIKAKKTNLYDKEIEYIQNKLNQFFHENRKIKVQFKPVDFGADIHYAGGVPNELLDKNNIQNGRLKGLNSIFAVGGSTLQYLPPMSPTYTFMANAYRIGKQFSTKEINGLS